LKAFAVTSVKKLTMQLSFLRGVCEGKQVTHYRTKSSDDSYRRLALQ